MNPPTTSSAVESVDAVVELARRQLEHEFEFKEPVGWRDGTTVQRVVERSTGRTLVLKALLRRTAEPAAEESFRATMNALAGFDHPNLTHVVRHGSTDTLFWFATEDPGSITLAARLAKHGPLELRAARRMLTQVAGALDHLHRHGIVHGAVKPSNILLDGEGWVRLVDLSFTRPEVRRISRPAADQYALGALAFECLTGSTPGSSADAVAQLRADVPARMVRAIERALDEDPARRFPSCAEFLWALEQDVSAAATLGSRPPRRISRDVVMIRDWERAPDPRRTANRAIRIGLGIVALVTLVGLVVAAPSLRTILGAGPAPPVPVARSTPASAVIPTTLPTADAPAADAPAAGAPAAGAPAATTPARTPPVRTTPAPVGTTSAAKLFINATPWGQISIDGFVIGNTPRANVDLPAGAHTIRVSRPGYAIWERTVRVAAGDTLRITDIVLVPIQP